MVGKVAEKRKTVFAKEGYPVHVIARHLEITEGIRNYALEKFLKAERFGGRILEATIILDIQKMVHSVEYILLINNTKVVASGRSSDMYASVDQAIEHLQAKLRRYHKRLAMHHAKSIEEIEMNVNVIQRIDPLEDINDQIEEVNLQKIEEEFIPHPVVSKETKPLHLLTQGEAIMKIELSGEHFMIYRSQEDMKLKVVYRRDDGNYGIIEPE